MDSLLDQLKRDEGFVDHVYKDSVNVPTIGYGINLLTEKIPESVAALWLQIKLQSVIDECNLRWPWLDALEPIRREVVYNMAYNLGVVGLAGFTNFLQAMAGRMFITASMEMKSSKWYDQVAPRSERLRQQLLTGERQ